MSLTIGVIPGDGIGPEVVGEAVKVLDAAARREGLAWSTEELPYGGRHYLASGTVLTDEDVRYLRSFDALLLGAVGHPEVAPGVLERGLLLRLRFELDLYINLRPVKLLPGVPTVLGHGGPQSVHFDVIRENTEDLYLGTGGVARAGTAQEVSTQEMLATRFGVERCLRYAFDLARRKQTRDGGRGELTLVHKTNVLTHCGATWSRTFQELGDRDYPEVPRRYDHVDACCMHMVTTPQRYETVVSPNMFGDILTDLGAAIAGGMGLAASGNLRPAAAGETPGAPSLFEPVHGSAPDIAGTDRANPLACMLSGAMLLRETGTLRDDEAAVRAGDRIEASVAHTAERIYAAEGPLGCRRIGDIVAEAAA